MTPEKNIEENGAAVTPQLVNDKYRAIIDSIDDGFCLVEIILDEAGKPVDLVYLETNRIFQQQTGLADVVGRRLREIIPGIEQEWIDFYGNVALTGEPARMEYFVEAVRRWFSAYAFRVAAENNLQVAVVFDDITDRKRREQRQEYLIKLNDTLRPLVNATEIKKQVTLIAMDYFGADRCYYCEIEDNNAIIRCDAIRGDLPSVAGVYPLGSFAVFKKVIDKGKPFIVQDSNTTDILDEPLRALCLQLQVISFVDVPVVKRGTAVGILCIVQSSPRIWTEAEVELAVETAERIWAAVERANAEEALRISEAWLEGQKQAFQAAMNGQPLAVSLGVLIQMVKEQTTGDVRTAFYMVPPGYDGLHHIVGMSEDFAKDVNGFVIGPQSLSCGLAMHLGKPVITPDVELEPRWAPWLSKAQKHEIRGSWSFPVQTDGGPVLGTFAMYFREPRKPNDREMELATVVAHAAAIIISRHTELVERTQAEAALRENEEQLKALLKQKDEFIGVASHELKTPVTSIKAYAEIVMDMLKEAGLGVESDVLKRLGLQIDRLSLLINDLLDTTKISEGKLSYRFELTDINELLKARIEEIQRTATHTFHVQLEDLPLITADKDRIGQVVINLLTNAIKYSEKGSVVTIKTVRLVNGIQVSVQDEGYGIAEDEQQKIFERFYRVTANHLDTYPGMGLGLYISAQIIERHGGLLEVKSTPGKGSTFFFTLPNDNEQL